MSFKQVSPKVRLFASDKTWIESNAVTQLSTIASKPDVEMAVGFPDLHLGKGGPVGAVFSTKPDIILPGLIGNDIGCGIGLFQTSLPDKKIKLDKWAKKLRELDSPYDERESWMKMWGLVDSGHDETLGTIGGGNHFAELHVIEALHDQAALRHMGAKPDQLFILVHSGSRGFGHHVFQEFLKQYPIGRIEGKELVADYMIKHDHAVYWAHRNRLLIAQRFASQLGGEADGIVNVPHNVIEKAEIGGVQYNLHRKGAAKTVGNIVGVVVPGSRGTVSYLVAPTDDQDDNLMSIAHGAGRKWSRSDCRARLSEKYSPESLSQTDLGSRVICEDKDLVYEEAPQAYKNIDQVIEDLVQAGLVTVVATLRPLITYKTRRDS